MDERLSDNSLGDQELNKCGAYCSRVTDEDNCGLENSTLASNKNVVGDIRHKGRRYVTKEKRFVINDMVETVDFGLLPEGWLQLRHISGLNVYLHRSSRVVTLSRPYSIGPSSVHYHRIPVSAIPCLAYRKANGQNFRTSEFDKDKSKAVDPIDKPNNETDRCSPEKSPFIPTEATQKIEELEVYDESSECLLSVVNEENNTLTITEVPNTDVTAQTNASFPLPCLRQSICSDKEEGELSSADDEKENSEEDRVKKPRLNETANTSSSTISLTQDSLPEEDEGGESINRCNIPVHSRSLPFGKKCRKRKFVNSLSKKSTLETPSIDQVPESDPTSISTSKQEVSTEVQELFAVKTQVFSVKDKQKESLLTPNDIREYCGRLFEIKVEDAGIRRNRKPNISKEPTKETEEAQKPLLMMSEQAKVIRYQIPSVDGNVSRQEPREGMINMIGKSYVCILHEYCQNVMRRQPTYQLTVLENDKNPYQITILINGKPYGTGNGQSKKYARSEAARKALETLIPDFQKIVGSDSNQTVPAVVSDRDMQLFEAISVTDPRLYELSVRMALPTPYNLLVECLSRSCVPESDLKSNMTSQGRSKHFFTLQLREHTVKVRCKNKREGRHLAAQHLLARLHPEVSTWSGLLRIYGPGSKPDKRNELETIQDAQIQQKSAVKASLIRLLKAKMSELADQWEKSGGNMHPKGKFFVSPYNLRLWLSIQILKVICTVLHL
ncbi:unnamed protein product [Heterobilharzia americana]|nr:unnamed protein product [Heterobilharzia americana]